MTDMLIDYKLWPKKGGRREVEKKQGTTEKKNECACVERASERQESCMGGAASKEEGTRLRC